LRRPFYNAAADVSGGATRSFHEKVFAVDNNTVTAAIYIAVAGTLQVTDQRGDVIALPNMIAGWHPIRISRVWSTNSTATGIDAVYDFPKSEPVLRSDHRVQQRRPPLSNMKSLATPPMRRPSPPPPPPPPKRLPARLVAVCNSELPADRRPLRAARRFRLFTSERGRGSRLSVTRTSQSRSVSDATCWVTFAHWQARRQTRRGLSLPRSQATCVGTYRSSWSGSPMPGRRAELDPP
jgi:hypothetical protein